MPEEQTNLIAPVVKNEKDNLNQEANLDTTTSSPPQTEAEKQMSQAEEQYKAGLERYRAFIDNKKPETEADRVKREKREKRNRLFAAIGDGLSAMANLYYTTQGAPNMYTGTNTMSEATKARQDKLKAEREANEKLYQDSYARLNELEYAMAKERYNRGLAKEKKKQDDVMHTLNILLTQSKISKAQYDAAAAQSNAELAKFKQEYAPQEAEDKHNESLSRTRSNEASVYQKNASAAVSEARATDIKKNGTGGGRAKYKLVIGGKTYEYDTQAEYEKAVRRYANEKGIKGYDETGRGSNVKRHTKPVSQVAAEVEEAYKQPAKKKSPTGGVGGKKSPTA